MGIFTNSTTSTIGGFYQFTFSSQPYTPPPPPYEGTFLPAVIHVFDYEVDLAKAGVAEIQTKVDEIQKEILEIAGKSNSACVSLESKAPSKIAALRSMQVQLARVRALIDAVEAKNKAARQAAETSEDQKETSEQPEVEREDNATPRQKEEPEAGPPMPNTGNEHLDEHLMRSRRVEAELSSSQARFKNASREVKRLYLKVMNLVHEAKHGKNEYLRELYDLANVARLNNSASEMQAILKAAQQYHSPQGKLALRTFLEQKRKALSDHYDQACMQLDHVSRSPAYHVHQLLEAGDSAAALEVFNRMLDSQHQGLLAALQQAEFAHSNLTGTFSNGETSMKFGV